MSCCFASTIYIIFYKKTKQIDIDVEAICEGVLVRLYGCGFNPTYPTKLTKILPLVKRLRGVVFRHSTSNVLKQCSETLGSLDELFQTKVEANTNLPQSIYVPILRLYFYKIFFCFFFSSSRCIPHTAE